MTIISAESTTDIMATITGNGLITGLPITVDISPGPKGQEILFVLKDSTEQTFPIPACLASVVHTERGVTLAHPSGKTLSIVEHFLCACALTGQQDLTVTVHGGPELPLLDGSAEQWVHCLTQHFGKKYLNEQTRYSLREAVFHRHNDDICIYALPSDGFQVTYSIDFDHPGLRQAAVYWSLADHGIDAIASAQTFGYVRELPILQAQGLAKGVTLENTLGITDDGEYTRPLKLDAEPIRHKIIDLIGDLSLMGINPLTINAHIYAINAGHGSHVAFAKQLQKALQL